jgi:hypothetical protein
MAHRQLAKLDQRNHRLGQGQQALDIGDMAAALVDKPRDLCLGQAFILGKSLIGARFFDRR